MVDFPTDKLNKALHRRGLSSTTKPHWRELSRRHDTVPSSLAIQAPEVIQGFSGSWAGIYGIEEGHRTQNAGQSPAPIQKQINRLGQPGMAEINFRPYDWGTNRKGKYGPSLLGHPISFSIVGPTVRATSTTFQWLVDNSGAQDKLIIDENATALSAPASPEAPTINTLQMLFGIDSIPEEGLYLTLSVPGATGRLDDGGGGTVVGGLGEGQTGDDGIAPFGGPRSSVRSRNQASKFEIFRVVAIETTNNEFDTLVLDSGKRIAQHFWLTVATTPVVRAITLFKPAAARLVMVPGSEKKTYAFVPPEKALNSDLMPSLGLWDTLGFFDPWTGYDNSINGFTGETDDFTQNSVLPVPVPVHQGRCRLQGIDGEAPVMLSTGRMRVRVPDESPFSAGNVGKVLNLLNVERFGEGTVANAASEGGVHIGTPEHEQLLGYWEIVAGGNDGSNYYDLRMVAQFNPDTGVPFYGNGELLRMATGSGPGEEVWFEFTLHEPVSSLWTQRFLHPAYLNAAKLDHLIDPQWARPSTKGRETAETWGHLGHPDKAIFDTSSSNAGAVGTNANPGSLLDLGFRVVFFPAKASGSDLVADFDNPITSNEVVLDPDSADKNQFLEVDYAAGLVHLSHTPVPGSGCTLCPSAGILNNASNPRGEVVFFASFVPFSREPGQMGVGTRITGGAPGYADVYGARKFWPLTEGQTITSGIRQTIKLDVQLSPLDIPATGFVDIVLGADTPNGQASMLHLERRVCTFGYTNILYNDVADNGGNTTLIGAFGGGVAASTLNPTAGNPMTAVLRRNVSTPNTLDGRVGTDFQFDTTYGYAKRSSVLRFNNALLNQEPDGSVNIDIQDPRTAGHEDLFADLFSSWVLSGGEMTSVGLGPAFGDTLVFNEMAVLIHGVRVVVNGQPVSMDMGTPGDNLVYIDGGDTENPVFAFTTTLPLPTTADVLIGQYTHDGVDITAYIDLRNPLTDVDKRWDITVGQPVGHAQPGASHFSTLAEAIEYVKAVNYTFTAGRQRRIKIIGPTLEDNAKLPIQPGIDGLIIEGSAIRGDGSAGTPHEIVWAGAAPQLFDLSDSANWVIRNVTFRYDLDGEAADTDPYDRCLATIRQTTTTVSNITFENCTLNGPAHGWLFADEALGAGGGNHERIRLLRCTAEELTDFAVKIDDAVGVSRDNLIDGCRFVCRVTNDVPAPETPTANRTILNFRATAGTRHTIRNTYLSGGYHGIYAGGAGPFHIEGCDITGTDQSGIWVASDLARVAHNDLSNVHTQAAAFHTAKVAVFVDANISDIWLGHNRLSVGGAGVAQSLYVDAGGARNTIIGNMMVNNAEVNGTAQVLANYVINLTVVDDTVVESNTINGALATGDRCRLVANTVTSTTTCGSSCQSQGNQYTGILTGGDESRFVGDVFGDPNAGFSTGRVVLGNDQSYTGCLFSDAFEGTVSQTRIESSEVNVWSNVTGELTASHVVNNLFLARAAAGLTFDGDQNHVCGNTIYSLDTTFTGEDGVCNDNYLGTVAAPTDLLIQGSFHVCNGNKVNGQVSLSAARSVFSGNWINDIATLSGSNCLYEGNIFDSDVTLTGEAEFKSNEVIGDMTLGSAGGVTQNLVGNRFAKLTTIADAEYLRRSVISGNHFTQTVNFGGAASLEDCTVQGNFFTGAFTCEHASRTTFTGNRCGGDVTLNDSDRIVVQGNWLATTGDVDVDLLMLGCDDYVCIGNYVSGQIYIDAGAATTNCGIVLGNRAALIGDGGGSAAPTNYQVTLGNKVDNGAGGTVYGANPATTTVNTNNISDDV